MYRETHYLVSLSDHLSPMTQSLHFPMHTKYREKAESGFYASGIATCHMVNEDKAGRVSGQVSPMHCPHATYLLDERQNLALFDISAILKREIDVRDIDRDINSYVQMSNMNWYSSFSENILFFSAI